MPVTEASESDTMRAVDQAVTITGQSLGGALTVRFNGVAASSTAVSDTQLSATVADGGHPEVLQSPLERAISDAADELGLGRSAPDEEAEAP